MRQALEDHRDAPLGDGLRATLAFLEKLTLAPQEVDEDDVAEVVAAGVSTRALRDAIEVAAAFNTIDRIADTLAFEPQSEGALAVGAKRLSTKGYA